MSGEFADMILALVEEMSETLAPKEDLMPALFMQGGHLPGDVVVCTPLTEGDPADRRRMATLLLRAAEPDRCALIDTGWSLKGEEALASIRGEALPPGVNANRIEQVCVLVKDGEKEETLYADIIRRKGEHPLLGDWEYYPHISEKGGLGEAVLRGMK